MADADFKVIWSEEFFECFNSGLKNGIVDIRIGKLSNQHRYYSSVIVGLGRFGSMQYVTNFWRLVGIGGGPKAETSQNSNFDQIFWIHELVVFVFL